MMEDMAVPGIESPKELLYFLMYLRGAAPFLDRVNTLPEHSWATVIARRSGYRPPVTWTPDEYKKLAEHVVTILKEEPDGETEEE